VTVSTRWDFVGLLFPEAALDDLHVDFFDSRMANRTGRRNVVVMNARTGIGVLEYLMRGMARSANRGHSQTFSENALSMDAL
jgi:hypothetical protein